MRVELPAKLVYEDRPWGSFVEFEHRPWYKLKKLSVSPGCRLSYQKHEHRSEFWAIVLGRAFVTLDGKVLEKDPGAFLWILAGIPHRVENKGLG